MRASNIVFRKVVVDDSVAEKDRREMEVIEITFPDGKVVALPATDVNAESGQRYCDLYAAKYQAFRDGKPDPDRVAQLEREIEEKKAELAGLHGDDWRVQENLGYGEKPTADETDPVEITENGRPLDELKHKEAAL